MSFYQSTLRGSTAGPSRAPAAKLSAGVGGSKPAAASDDEDGFGKGSISLLDPVGSVGATIGSLTEFGAGLTGGAFGAVGQLGFGDGQNLGALPGIAVDRAGQLGFGDGANLGAVAEGIGGAFGAGLDALSAPSRETERQTALDRLRNAQGDGPILGDIPARSVVQLLGPVFAATGNTSVFADAAGRLPPDIQQRLDEGESIDVLAEELVARGAGFSEDPGVNLAAQIVFDPLNVIAPGLSKAAQGVRGAGMAVRGRGAEELSRLGIGQRAIGTAYNLAARGMTAAGAAFVDKAIGSVTSGVFHALGTNSYRRIVSGYKGLDPEYAARIEDAAAVANRNHLDAVLGDDIGADVTANLHPSGGAVDEAIVARRRAYSQKHLERRSQEKMEDVAPTFAAMSSDELLDFSARGLAMVTGSSVEDAVRVLGGKADVKTAQSVHWWRYGKAIDEFGEAREASRSGKSSIDLNRLTLIADDTLTVERAKEVQSLIGDDLVAAVDRYSVLSNRFGGKNFDHAEVKAFAKKLADEGALPQTVKAPKSGKNKLPSALGQWRARWVDNGYELGFEPKDGWKIIEDADGNVIHSRPFIPVTTGRDPVTMRNGLGRALDGLRRGIGQRTIVAQSRQRLVRRVSDLGLPISPNQARAIHKAIIDEAAGASVTPRALAGLRRDGEYVYDNTFRRFLTPEEYDEVVNRVDPTWLVMDAFEGNWRTVGLTQKFTGRAKRGAPIIAKITEDVYPKARFTYRPDFQLQEMVESPFFNALRGVTDRPISDNLVPAYKALSELPEFRYLTEASYLHLSGQRVAQQFLGHNTKVGRAMGRFKNIQSRKETARVRQVLSEHGEEFRDAVQGMNPKFWRVMEETYGTKDPSVIADKFLAERLALASGDIDETMRLIDSVRPSGLDGVAGEMVWQAFRDSFRQTSVQAFKTHFFNIERGWLERTLNHPFLGMYPLSYMWGKVLPEFARFLIKRPFGKDVPLVPLVNLERVQQAYIGALADDSEFRAFIEEREELIRFALLLIPGNPANLAVHAPAWMRDVSEASAKGQNFDVGRSIDRSAKYALSITRVEEAIDSGADLVGIGGDIFANLEKAAAEFDGQFRVAAQP